MQRAFHPPRPLPYFVPPHDVEKPAHRAGGRGPSRRRPRPSSWLGRAARTIRPRAGGPDRTRGDGAAGGRGESSAGDRPTLVRADGQAEAEARGHPYPNLPSGPGGRLLLPQGAKKGETVRIVVTRRRSPDDIHLHGYDICRTPGGPGTARPVHVQGGHRGDLRDREPRGRGRRQGPAGGSPRRAAFVIFPPTRARPRRPRGPADSRVAVPLGGGDGAGRVVRRAGRPLARSAAPARRVGSAQGRFRPVARRPAGGDRVRRNRSPSPDLMVVYSGLRAPKPRRPTSRPPSST